jgi:hypothetical protein
MAANYLFANRDSPIPRPKKKAPNAGQRVRGQLREGPTEIRLTNLNLS